MTLYGIGLGPGAADLLTVRGKRVLEDVAVVYTPGRLSRRVAREYVAESKLGDLDFPMTRDPEELRRAWREAADAVAPTALDADAAFVTLGDPVSTRRLDIFAGRWNESIRMSMSGSFRASAL
jgi:precorrin-2/cobalt-factor-2 C20-methyltransferase